MNYNLSLPFGSFSSVAFFRARLLPQTTYLGSHRVGAYPTVHMSLNQPRSVNNCGFAEYRMCHHTPQLAHCAHVVKLLLPVTATGARHRWSNTREPQCTLHQAQAQPSARASNRYLASKALEESSRPDDAVSDVTGRLPHSANDDGLVAIKASNIGNNSFWNGSLSDENLQSV
jgi:hypothetical protein